MKNVFAYLTLLAVAVSSVPLVLDSHLLTDGDAHGRLAVLHHVSHVAGPGATHPKLRFLFLVPKLHKLGDLADGFASGAVGHGHKHHDFLKLEDGEHLVDLVGLSDCKTWHGVLLTVWTTAGVVYKGLGGVKEDDVFKLHHFTTPLELATYVKGHAKYEHLGELFKKGVPTHVFTHHLHHLVKNLL